MRRVSGFRFLATRCGLVVGIVPKLKPGLLVTADMGQWVAEQTESSVRVWLRRQVRRDTQFPAGAVLCALADLREQSESRLFRWSILAALPPGTTDCRGVPVGRRHTAGTATQPDQDGSELPPSSLASFCRASLQWNPATVWREPYSAARSPCLQQPGRFLRTRSPGRVHQGCDRGRQAFPAD